MKQEGSSQPVWNTFHLNFRTKMEREKRSKSKLLLLTHGLSVEKDEQGTALQGPRSQEMQLVQKEPKVPISSQEYWDGVTE